MPRAVCLSPARRATRRCRRVVLQSSQLTSTRGNERCYNDYTLPSLTVAVTVATGNNKPTAAESRAKIPSCFVAKGDVEEQNMPSCHLCGAPIREHHAADADRGLRPSRRHLTHGRTPFQLPCPRWCCLLCTRKCRTTPLRRMRRHLAGGVTCNSFPGAELLSVLHTSKSLI